MSKTDQDLFDEWLESTLLNPTQSQESLMFLAWKSQKEQQTPTSWSVFNGWAEVASGLSYEEATDYLTQERLDRGWLLVCVVDKTNFPLKEENAA